MQDGSPEEVVLTAGYSEVLVDVLIHFYQDPAWHELVSGTTSMRRPGARRKETFTVTSTMAPWMLILPCTTRQVK